MLSLQNLYFLGGCLASSELLLHDSLDSSADPVSEQNKITVSFVAGLTGASCAQPISLAPETTIDEVSAILREQQSSLDGVCLKFLHASTQPLAREMQVGELIRSEDHSGIKKREVTLKVMKTFHALGRALREIWNCRKDRLIEFAESEEVAEVFARRPPGLDHTRLIYPLGDLFDQKYNNGAAGGERDDSQQVNDILLRAYSSHRDPRSLESFSATKITLVHEDKHFWILRVESAATGWEGGDLPSFLQKWVLPAILDEPLTHGSAPSKFLEKFKKNEGFGIRVPKNGVLQTATGNPIACNLWLGMSRYPIEIVWIDGKLRAISPN